MYPIGPVLLIVLLAAKYRSEREDAKDEEKDLVREALEPGAGLDYEPPAKPKRKTKLRVVK